MNKPNKYEILYNTMNIGLS